MILPVSSGKVFMTLKQKLTLFVLLAIILPIVVITIFSSMQIYKSSVNSQREYLNHIAAKINDNINNIRDNYTISLRDFAENNYLKDKINFYSKYWEKIDPAILEADILPLKDEIEKFALSRDIESIAVYRKSYDKYKKVTVVGKSTYIPDEVYIDSLKKYFANSFYMFTYVVYLNTFIPIEKNGQEIGLILMQKNFDRQYFTNTVIQYGVDIAVQARGRFVFSTFPNIESVAEKFSQNIPEVRFGSYQYSNVSYNFFVYPLDFENSMEGKLYIGMEQGSYLKNGNPINFQLFLLTIICVMIPVVTFYIWGSRLISSIRSLEEATNAVTQGNYDHQILSSRNDELGYLSYVFDKMVYVLKTNHEMLNQNNRELALLNHYIDAVFQSLMVNTVVFDREYRIILANQSAKSELKFPGNNPSLHLFEIPFFAGHKEELSVLVEKIFCEATHAVLDKLKSSNKIYSVNLYPVIENENSVNGIIMVLIDITEHLSLENAVMKSEKLAAVGQFAAGIAHEIGNPMGIILNHVQLIATGKLSKEEERVYIARVESEVKRINVLIQRLLSFSRDETQSMGPINLTQLVRQILDLFEPKFKEKKVKLSLNFHSDRIMIRGNTDSLKQVFFNIINNAIQSIHHQHGRVDVNIEREKEKTLVSVLDNGTGIEEEYLDKIFDPFFTNKGKNNTGLGLPLSYNIMKRHYGDINVKSNAGKGTEVDIIFPNGAGHAK